MLITRNLTNAGSPLCTPKGNPLVGIVVNFTIVNALGQPCSVFDTLTGERVVGYIATQTDASGQFSVDLWPNDRGEIATQYFCTINYPGSESFAAGVPSGSTPLTWLQFKTSGLPVTPQIVTALTAYIAQMDTAAAIAAAQAATATTEAGIATANAVLTAADAVSTHADVVLTHADVIAANAAAAAATSEAVIAAGLSSTATVQASLATSAAASLDAALASFRSKWLGSFSTDPLLDGNGNTLSVGAEYFNTITNVIRIYTASGWANPDAAALLDMTNAALSAIASASSASTAGTYSQQSGMYAAAALISEQNAAFSATTSTNSANLAAASVLSQLTSLLTQTQAARDAALAGLGAADQSLNLAALSSGLQLALDLAGQASKISLVDILNQVNTLTNSLIPLTITQTEVLESAIAVALDLIGATVKQINSGTVPLLDISGNKLRIRNANTPATATSAGNQGEHCWDSGYFYVCTATNTWRRSALTAW